MRGALDKLAKFFATALIYLAFSAGLAASLHVGYLELKFFGVLLALAFFWIGVFIAPFYMLFAYDNTTYAAAGLLALTGAAICYVLHLLAMPKGGNR